ncbi:Uncharacterised protein [Metamycoplasma cloacale]|uniref:Uncharacterized protein n=2 Tax=Metamycoplasma cloacale TaxID=92401 RepID=A0A2Z4LME3_9BACT|nr:hypothetical protein [Metamycoplasma cloacale]AWX42890.1 hypothetical protein DK849_02365 [Metamycoplasma cloacale]VEU79286.1 Uncharacterised protein [Metamycoplasma cloacale]
MKSNIESNSVSSKKQVVEKQYYFSRDTKLIWTFILFLTIFFIVISFINVKWITSIHSYSINIVFGCFSILFYALIVLLCLRKIFNLKKTYSFKIIHISLGRISFIFFAVILLTTAIMMTAMLKKDDFTTGKSFTFVFNKWFESFKNGGNEDPNANLYLPNKYTLGVFATAIFALLSIFGLTAGKVLTFIFAFVAIISSIICLFIRDERFALMSLNKEKRTKAKEMFNKNKQSNKSKMIKIHTNNDSKYVPMNSFNINENKQFINNNANNDTNPLDALNDTQENEIIIESENDFVEAKTATITVDNKQLNKDIETQLIDKTEVNELNTFDIDDDPFNETVEFSKPEVADQEIIEENKPTKENNKKYSLIKDEEDLF